MYPKWPSENGSLEPAPAAIATSNESGLLCPSDAPGARRCPREVVRRGRARLPAARAGPDRRDRAGAKSSPEPPRLPAERALAAALALSRTTVVSAYEELQRPGARSRAAGEAAPGRGAPFFSCRGPGLRLREDPSGSFRRHPVYRSLVEGPGDTIEFLGLHICPPPRMLPRELFRISTRNRSPGAGAGAGLHADGAAGAAPASIARHLTGWGRGDPAKSRCSSPTGPSRRSAWRARSFSSAATVVVVEDPTYLGSIDIFTGLGARLLPVPVGVPGSLGWVARLKDLVSRAAPRLVYLMPTFHNPTGAVMPEALPPRARPPRRARCGIPILEDNTLAPTCRSPASRRRRSRPSTRRRPF